MRFTHVALVVMVFVSLAACSRDPLPPKGHVLVYFDTDAPLPRAAGERAAADDPVPLFDRLVVEVFEPNAVEPCDGCRRELALDRRMLAESRASIQVPAAPGTAGYRVRARLFLAAHLVTGSEPPAAGCVDVVSLLAPAPDEGGIEQTIFLATEAVGTPTGTLAEPLPASAGRPNPSKVGSWAGAARVACPLPAAPGEACVRGGAFWMGRPGERSELVENAADRPRLVVLSPYFLDENESTVRDVRAFEQNEPGIVRWNGTTDGDSTFDFCTYLPTEGPRDSLPVSCVYWPTARHYCLSKGKELPTEAQFEHAAGALASRRFVWGEDPPECGDAVWGRGGNGYLAPLLAPCRSKVSGPACVGASCLAARARDALPLEDGGMLHDLAGNLSEWTLDRFNRQDESCWSAQGVQRDPLCTSRGVDGGFPMSLRGGSWLSTGSALAASSRQGEHLDIAQPFIGFRCARTAPPVTCGLVTPGLYTGPTHGDDDGTLFTVGIGCSGVISVLGQHEAGGVFLLVGTIDEHGRARLEGSDIDTAKVVQTFVGEVVDATHLRGTWTSADGKKGTWSVAPKR